VLICQSFRLKGGARACCQIIVRSSGGRLSRREFWVIVGVGSAGAEARDCSVFGS